MKKLFLEMSKKLFLEMNKIFFFFIIIIILRPLSAFHCPPSTY